MSWKKTFYCAFVAQFFAIAGFAFVLPFLPFFIVKDLGVPDGPEAAKWSGLLASATGLTLATFAIIWGMVADRVGRKPMVLRSMFGGAAVLVLMALSRNVYDLFFLRLLQGALTGTVTASLALVASVTPRERTGYTLGMMQAAVFSGNSIGPLIGAVTANYLGFRWSFVAAAGMLFFSGLLVKFGTEENFTPAPRTAASRSYFGMFAIAGFAAILFTVFQVHMANQMPSPIFPLFVRELASADIKEATRLTGHIMAVAGFAAAFGAWFMGRLSDRIGHKRLLVISTALAGVLVLPQAFARNVTDLFVLRVLLGFAVAAIMPSTNALIRQITPSDSIGKAFGLTSCVGGLAFFVGPLAGGYLTFHTGSLRLPFIVNGIMLVIAAGLAWWGIRKADALPEDDFLQQGVMPSNAPARVIAAPEGSSPGPRLR